MIITIHYNQKEKGRRKAHNSAYYKRRKTILSINKSVFIRFHKPKVTRKSIEEQRSFQISSSWETGGASCVLRGPKGHWKARVSRSKSWENVASSLDARLTTPSVMALGWWKLSYSNARLMRKLMTPEQTGSWTTWWTEQDQKS